MTAASKKIIKIIVHSIDGLLYLPFIKPCHVHVITNLTHISEFQVIFLWHLFPSFKQNGSFSGDSKPVNRGPGAGTAEEHTRDPTQEMISGRGSLRHSPSFAHAHCVPGI